MEYSRQPRFKRSNAVRTVELTSRDREIIRLVHQHRFLRSSHIVALIGGSSQPLLRRLQLLYHHGYLERPLAQIEYYHKGGSRPMVYGVANKGVAELKQMPGFSSHRNWNKKNQGIRRMFLEHALFVSDCMVSLELACRKNGNVRLLNSNELSNQSKARQPFKWKVKLTNQIKLGIIPDQVFALEYINHSGKSDHAFFFLEADRGTMPVVRKNLSQTSFYRKLLAYQATWAQSIHQARFCFNRFRVLTITKSPERLQSLVNTCSRLTSGQGLFLFADFDSLAKSPDLFSLLWQTGRAGQAATLLD